MIKPNVIDYDLKFASLTPRTYTDLIVVHHTGNDVDDDLSAREIHNIHQALGWSGCGYHYIIRKDGTIEAGRPRWAVGAHAEGANWHSIGVHLSGNFEIGTPTAAQIESAAYLIGWLCERYDIVPTANGVKGHCQLMATACPGRNLYNILQTIRGKAIWYQQNYRGGD
ncbi:MAG: N-acetylmuramoyl-L-alanine amidase [Acidaminococcaceae bacterium]|nr:N-acetylmuramoyl-L-alanine amidase [Acidaminococcaceae bacterium]